ncbi:MAG: TonB-dependent receptor plug domain-containing protein [Tannerellaceae bacterium]|nr:TonB-dependent receptor plug domain-containing protein [Tannerellaceae bacterium]
MKRILLLFFQLLCTFASAQEMTSEAVQDSILKQLALFPQEKIHLHTDRVMYIPGEKIWFKAYVVDAFSHQSPTHSQYVYVELINASDSLAHRVMVSNDENGLFHGSIFLSEKAPEGDYTLRAYTRYMENLGDDYFFKKNIRIGKINNNYGLQIANYENEGSRGNRQEEFDVSFFPEGGNPAEGVVCRIAFKALNRQGTSAFISGEVVDGEGTPVVDVSTVFAGMGSFAFMPEQGVAYYLNCKNSAGQAMRFKLPTATKTLSLGVNSINGQHFIQVKKSPGIAESPLYLLVHCKGEVFYFAPWNHRAGYISILKEQLPAGVIQIVLLDNEMNPISERLVFNKNNVSEKVALRTDKTIYGKREKVNATLNFPLSSERAGDGFSHFSVAVTDDKDMAIDSLCTITASLLLSSELRGHIESPGYYLQDNASAEYALDHLMMTHGWRRYELSEAIKGNYSLPVNGYELEKEMTGSVRSGLFDKPTKGEVVLFSSDGIYDETETDADGRFCFGLHYPDGVRFFVQAKNQKGSEWVKLTVNPDQFPKLKYAPVSRSLFSSASTQENNLFDFIKKAEQRAQYDEDIRRVNLEEIVVTTNRIEKRDEKRLKYPFNRLSDMTIYSDDIEKRGATELSELLSGISGGIFTRPRGSINGGTQFPLVVVNGTPLYWNVEDPITPLDDIRISDVESIDIFKGIGAAVFGMQGGNGVISITTKNASSHTNETNSKTNAVSVTPSGYQKPVEFYAPRYDTPESKYNGSPDYRTAIYWKPNLVVPDEGKAMFEFYTADFPTTCSVVIEGLTTDGKIVRQVEKIVVRDDTTIP